jgi:hypothetical protein
MEDDIDEYEADATVCAVAEAYNISTQQKFSTKLVTGHHPPHHCRQNSHQTPNITPNILNTSNTTPHTPTASSFSGLCRAPSTQATGHAHFVEFNETLSLRVESPFDTILLTVRHHLDHAPTAGTASVSPLGGSELKLVPAAAAASAVAAEEAEAEVASTATGVRTCFVVLPLDDRFLRGRGCALPLRDGDGQRPADFASTALASSASAPAKANHGILELEAAWVDPMH